MKNPRYELQARKQREYHRTNPWRLSHGGLFVPHAYHDMTPDSLSYGDTVGFILNGRRVIVWWQHPRYLFANQINEKAIQEADNDTQGNSLTKNVDMKYRRVGRFSKDLFFNATLHEDRKKYQSHVNEITKRLSKEGIDAEFFPQWKWQRMNWAMGLSLVAPLEVRNETELAEVAKLAKRLILGQTTLKAEFKNYIYQRSDWLLDQMKIASLIQI
jgi:hypothetical protein